MCIYDTAAGGANIVANTAYKYICICVYMAAYIYRYI